MASTEEKKQGFPQGCDQSHSGILWGPVFRLAWPCRRKAFQELVGLKGNFLVMTCRSADIAVIAFKEIYRAGTTLFFKMLQMSVSSPFGVFASWQSTVKDKGCILSVKPE